MIYNERVVFVRKEYSEPVLELVNFATNTALCGSCEHSDSFSTDIEALEEAFGESLFSSMEQGGCAINIDEVGFEAYCKFASEGFIFIS